MVKRDDKAYKQCLEWATSTLTELLDYYRTQVFEEDMTARLKRDQMDQAIRRYQGYAIQGRFKAHYFQKGVSLAPKDCIFEHVIPEGQVRDMLIDGVLTINQALNSPCCIVSRDSNAMLNARGMHDSNATPWNFFRRYKEGMVSVTGAVPEFETYNGQAIPDLATWTLEDHYKMFDVK